VFTTQKVFVSTCIYRRRRRRRRRCCSVV